MKFVALKSVGHSIADSLASGICLLIGYYEIDIFVEAAGSSAGFIEVDFLTGATAGSPASSGLLRAVDLFREVVPEQCKKQGAEYSRLAKLTVRFGTDAVYGPHFTVKVEDIDGRKSTQLYVGRPGKKLRRGHSLFA
jgi:hypothetical protein